MTFWHLFSHFVSGCSLFFFFPLFLWLFVASGKANMWQAKTSLVGWTSHHVQNVPSKGTAFPAHPWPTGLHPGLLGEDACWPSGLQAEKLEPQDWSWDFWAAPSSLCSNVIPFSAFLFPWKWKKHLQILLTSDSGSFSPRKCKSSPELHELFPQELSLQEELVWL